MRFSKKSFEIGARLILTHARYQYSVLCAAHYLRVRKWSISEFENRVHKFTSNATNSQNLVILGLPEHAQIDSGQDPVPARHSRLIPFRANARWDIVEFLKQVTGRRTLKSLIDHISGS